MRSLLACPMPSSLGGAAACRKESKACSSAARAKAARHSSKARSACYKQLCYAMRANAVAVLPPARQC